MKVCACGKCHKIKGCGKPLGDDRFQFYCGKGCEWCPDGHIHYCDECKTQSHGNTQSKEKEDINDNKRV